MISSLFYYLLFSSVAPLRGIGFDRVFLRPANRGVFLLTFCKNAAAALGTVLVTFLLSRAFLVPCRMGEFTPLVAALLFILLSVFLEAILTIINRRTTTEFMAPLLCVFLALSETGELSQALGVVFFALLSYYGFSLLLYAIRKRLEFSSPTLFFAEEGLMLISSAVIMLILFSLGASWLFTGGGR